jgi:RNA polymerase sigma-70 factor (ECF subfamily)
MWMFGVARNLVVSHRRSTRRRSALHEKLRSQLQQSAALTPGDDHSDVRAFLGRLTETDQEIIRLTYRDGFTQKQAAVVGHAGRHAP